jgi:multiple sugar transport system permease protein
MLIQSKAKRRIEKGFYYLLLILLGLFFGGPFIWTFFTSLKPVSEIYQMPPSLLPQSEWRWSNYREIFDVAPFGRYISNTLILVVLTVTGRVLSTVMVAYAFARFRWPGRDFVFILAMATIILPREVTTIPTYIFFSKLQWLNTWYPLFVPAWFAIDAFFIFLFRQFFMSIPRDLDEAAYIDGAGPFRILFSILLPLCKPVIWTAVVITSIAVWNDFWGPYIFLTRSELFPIAVGLRIFANEAYRVSGYGQPTYHLLMAGSVVAIVPCVLLFLFAQRYFVRGIVTSGLKGV